MALELTPLEQLSPAIEKVAGPKAPATDPFLIKSKQAYQRALDVYKRLYDEHPQEQSLRLDYNESVQVKYGGGPLLTTPAHVDRFFAVKLMQLLQSGPDN